MLVASCWVSCSALLSARDVCDGRCCGLDWERRVQVANAAAVQLASSVANQRTSRIRHLGARVSEVSSSHACRAAGAVQCLLHQDPRSLPQLRLSEWPFTCGDFEPKS